MGDLQKKKVTEELDDIIKDAIVTEVLRKVNSNMPKYCDKMLDICTHLNKKYGIGADRIEKILDGITEGKVFYIMFGGEYTYWVNRLNVNCEKYSMRRQNYIAKNYDRLKP